MTARMLREHSNASPSALRVLYELHDRHRLSARGHGRVLRVARTVADLEGSDTVGPEHVSLAAALRLDTAALALAA
jgi:magnesium chelatase family protein